jgi:glutamate synthase domain-containing protein 3
LVEARETTRKREADVVKTRGQGKRDDSVLHYFDGVVGGSFGGRHGSRIMVVGETGVMVAKKSFA